MSKKEDQDFAKWREELKAGLSDEQAAALDQLAETDALRDTYRGTIREKDYYTRLNKLSEERDSLKAEREKFGQEKQNMYTWYNEEAPKNKMLTERNKKLEEQVNAFKGQLGDLDDDPTLNKGGPTVDSGELEQLKEEVAKLGAQTRYQDQAIPKLLADFGDVVTENTLKGYNLNPSDILKHSADNRVDVRTAFMELTQEKRAEMEEARIEKLKAEAEARGREEAKKEFSQNLSSPDGLRPRGPSIVDRITGGQTDEQFGSDAALQEFIDGDYSSED